MYTLFYDKANIIGSLFLCKPFLHACCFYTEKTGRYLCDDKMSCFCCGIYFVDISMNS